MRQVRVISLPLFKISADISINWPINWNSAGHRNEKAILVAFTGIAD
jgi:hypothetical protein